MTVGQCSATYDRRKGMVRRVGRGMNDGRGILTLWMFSSSDELLDSWRLAGLVGSRRLMELL